MGQTEAEYQAARAVGFILAVAIAVGAQRMWPHARLQGSVLTNVALWAIGVAAVGSVCGGCTWAVAEGAANAGIGLFNAVPAPGWIGLLTTVLALDLVSYGWHRANHAVAFLWRFHRVHHSDSNFTVSTGARFHPGELLLSLPLRLIAVAALGASPSAVILFESLFALANLFEHGDINLPRRLERAVVLVCVVPALHRRHHSRRPDQLNTNFGTIFTFWDRLCATYGENDSATRIDTGLPRNGQCASLGEAIVLPLRPLSEWR